MNLIAAIEPVLPGEAGFGRTVAFNDAWLWPVLFIAAVFIGYLCVDAWIIHRRKRRMEEWRRRARNAVSEELIRR